MCMLHVPLPRCSKVTPCSPVPRAPSADENTPRRPTPGQWSLRRGHLYFLLWRPLTKQGSQHEQGSECREGELQRSSEYKITGHQYADETLQPREEKHGRICIWICLYVHVCRGSLKESVREKKKKRERERERERERSLTHQQYHGTDVKFEIGESPPEYVKNPSIPHCLKWSSFPCLSLVLLTPLLIIMVLLVLVRDQGAREALM